MMPMRFTLDRVLFESGNLKVTDLHRQTGVNRNTLYAMYNNKLTRLDVSVMERICKALDCQPGDLMTYDKGEGQ